MAKKTPETRIKRARKELLSTIADLPEKRKNTATSLVDNAAFMLVTLEDLREKITAEGTTIEYQNGENQWGTKQSPDVNTYNTMIKNFVMLMKVLLDQLPSDSPEANAMMQFITKGMGGK